MSEKKRNNDITEELKQFYVVPCYAVSMSNCMPVAASGIFSSESSPGNQLRGSIG